MTQCSASTPAAGACTTRPLISLMTSHISPSKVQFDHLKSSNSPSYKPNDVHMATSTFSSPPITDVLYFRLLKKSEVLNRLLDTNATLMSKLHELDQMKQQHSKMDIIHHKMFEELAKYQTKYVQVQQFYLDLLEQMTQLQLHHEQLQAGKTNEEAFSYASTQMENEAIKDLHSAALQATDLTSFFHGNEGKTLLTEEDTASTLVNYALKTVGKQRVKVLEKIFHSYESQCLTLKNEKEQLLSPRNALLDEKQARILELENQLETERIIRKKKEDKLDNLIQENTTLHEEIKQIKQKLDEKEREKRQCQDTLENQMQEINKVIFILLRL
jgi:hypothetical protein